MRILTEARHWVLEYIRFQIDRGVDFWLRKNNGERW